MANTLAEHVRRIGRGYLRPFVAVVDEQKLLTKMSPEKIKAAKEGIDYLVRESAISDEDAGTLLANANVALDALLQKSVTRRQFIGKGTAYVGGAAVGGGVLFVAGRAILGGLGDFWDRSFGATAQRNRAEEAARKAAEQFAYNQRLETTNTLGDKSSVESYTGWTVRYARRSETQDLVPTATLSKPLLPKTNIKLFASKLDEADDTGIVFNEHIRTTDNILVGKLSIGKRANLSYPYDPVISEEHVLRDQPADGIDIGVLVFEQPSSKTVRYLSLVRPRTIDATAKPDIQLRLMQKP